MSPHPNIPLTAIIVPNTTMVNPPKSRILMPVADHDRDDIARQSPDK